MSTQITGTWKIDEELQRKAKRTFINAWLKNERFKNWIRKVPSNDKAYHCLGCKKNLSCDTYPTKHANSPLHKKRMENIHINPDKKIEARRFHQSWLEIEEIKPWLRQATDNKNAFYCIFCDKTMVGGLSQIYRHAGTMSHITASNTYTIVVNESDNIVNESFISFNERKKSAEIRYASLIAEKNIPYHAAKDILALFKEIGKDPVVLDSMSMGKTKCKNIITNVLQPVETERMVNIIQNTRFSVFINETSDVTNEKWMAFLVRYVDPESMDVCSQLVKLINIDAKDSSTEKIFNAFKCEMWRLNIPFSNIIALSCDNTSVMMRKYESFKRKLSDMCKNVLIFDCPCHSSDLIVNSACSKIPGHCEDFVKKIVNFINSNPESLVIFREFSDCFQERNQKKLNLSGTRWLSHHAAIKRIIESWNTIKLFLTDITVNEQSTSAKHLLNLMTNHSVKPYLLFLEYILNLFTSFKTYFQVLETRVHLLQPKSLEFLIKVSRHFLKPELIKNVNENFEFSYEKYHKPLTKIHLGLECEEYLNKILNVGHADIVENIRKNCVQFYITTAQEICQRLPVNNEFLSRLKVFHPEMALCNTERENSLIDVHFIAQTLHGFDENALKDEWLVLHNSFSQEEKHDLSILNFDEMWKTIFQRNNEYPNLKSLLNVIRSLPNSNSDSERIFSYLPDLKTKKRNKLSVASVNATCVLKSSLNMKNETAVQSKIMQEHLSLMKSDKLYRPNPNKPKNYLKIFASDNEEVEGPPSPTNAE